MVVKDLHERILGELIVCCGTMVLGQLHPNLDDPEASLILYKGYLAGLGLNAASRGFNRTIAVTVALYPEAP
jgi:hypothetical protein